MVSALDGAKRQELPEGHVDRLLVKAVVFLPNHGSCQYGIRIREADVGLEAQVLGLIVNIDHSVCTTHSVFLDEFSCRSCRNFNCP